MASFIKALKILAKYEKRFSNCSNDAELPVDSKHHRVVLT
jgi:hypothetical protein